MSEIVNDKYDVERIEINRVSCISLKFDWTIEYCPSDSLLKESSKFNLPGSIWHFIIKSRYSSSSSNYVGDISVEMDPNKTVYVKGTIKTNDEVEEIYYKITSGSVIKCDISLKYCGSLPEVCKLLFNLKVYGLTPLDKIIFTQDRGNSKFMEAECRKNLSINLKTLWKNPQFSDVRIQVGEETIAAHKNVLFAKSPVFARMFLSPAVESKQDLVTVEDVSYGTMERFLGFLYGDFPDMEALQDLEELCELYYVSDKYEVADLRNWCSHVLIERMTTDNVFRLIDLFDSHSDPECKKLVEDFCLVHLKDVMETDGWKAMILKNPNFASLMCRRMSNYFQ